MASASLETMRTVTCVSYSVEGGAMVGTLGTAWTVTGRDDSAHSQDVTDNSNINDEDDGDDGDDGFLVIMIWQRACWRWRFFLISLFLAKSTLPSPPFCLR